MPAYKLKAKFPFTTFAKNNMKSPIQALYEGLVTCCKSRNYETQSIDTEFVNAPLFKYYDVLPSVI